MYSSIFLGRRNLQESSMGRELGSIDADQAIDLYLKTIFIPHLTQLGLSDVPGDAMNIGLADTRTRLRSLLIHWQDLPTRRALLLIGEEEATFYEPQSAPLDVRSLVVIAIRNSLIEDLGSEGSTLLPKGWNKKYGRMIPDEEMRQITEQAIRFWQKIDIDHLSPSILAPECDIFGAIARQYPRAWYVWTQLAQATGENATFAEYAGDDLPNLPMV